MYVVRETKITIINCSSLIPEKIDQRKLVCVHGVAELNSNNQQPYSRTQDLVIPKPQLQAGGYARYQHVYHLFILPGITCNMPRRHMVYINNCMYVRDYDNTVI